MASYMTKISSQGQVSVPVEVRRTLGVEPGAIIEWAVESGQVVVRKKGRFTWDDLSEISRPYRPSKPVSLEEMDEAIASGAVERYERSTSHASEPHDAPRKPVKKHASR